MDTIEKKETKKTLEERMNSLEDALGSIKEFIMDKNSAPKTEKAETAVNTDNQWQKGNGVTDLPLGPNGFCFMTTTFNSFYGNVQMSNVINEVCKEANITGVGERVFDVTVRTENGTEKTFDLLKITAQRTPRGFMLVNLQIPMLTSGSGAIYTIPIKVEYNPDSGTYIGRISVPNMSKGVRKFVQLERAESGKNHEYAIYNKIPPRR